MQEELDTILKEAVAQYQRGNLKAAAIKCSEVLKLEPENEAALLNLAIIHFRGGNYETSLKIAQQILSSNPKHKTALSLREKSHIELKDFDAVIANYEEVLQSGEATEQDTFNLAFLYKGHKKDIEKAKHYYELIIQKSPHNTRVLQQLGEIACEQGNYTQAEQYLEKAAHINPEDRGIRKILRFAYVSSKNHSAAQKTYSELIKAFPQKLELHPEYAEFLLNSRQLEKCYDYCLEHLKDDPNNIPMLLILSSSLIDQKENDLALNHLKRIIMLNPTNRQATYWICYCLLLEKNFSQGWDFYNLRWSDQNLKETLNTFKSFPLWDTKSKLNKKNLVLSLEQGYGDFIQFARYIEPLKKEFPQVKIYLLERSDLNRLIEHAFPSIELVSDIREIKVDYWFPLLNLALYFDKKGEEISSKPYIQAPKQHIDLGLNKKQKSLGLCWQGSRHHEQDKKRSLSLSHLAPLLENLDDTQFVDLQYEEEESMSSLMTGNNSSIVETAGKIHDFLDSAQIIEQIDIVITVDTVIAHLAGAMGKKTFLLLPYINDWRWGTAGEKSYWYDSITIIRQEDDCSWEKVIEKLILRLQKDNGK